MQNFDNQSDADISTTNLQDIASTAKITPIFHNGNITALKIEYQTSKDGDATDFYIKSKIKSSSFDHFTKKIDARIKNGDFIDPTSDIEILNDLRKITDWKANTSAPRVLCNENGDPIFTWLPKGEKLTETSKTTDKNNEDKTEKNPNPIKKKALELFSYSGRINRLEYLTINMCVVFILFIGATLSSKIQVPDSAPWVILAPFFLTLFALILINILAAIRRLHDIGFSGWFSLLLMVPYINSLVALILFFAPGEKGNSTQEPPDKNKDYRTIENKPSKTQKSLKENLRPHIPYLLWFITIAALIYALRFFESNKI